MYGRGSTGRMVKELADEMENRGHQAYAAYGFSGTGSVREMRVGSLPGHKWHALMSRIFGLQGYSSKYATRRLIRKIREIDPDVIHLHNLHSNYLNIGMLFEYLKNSGKGIVWTLHDCWAFTGGCMHFSNIGCTKWAAECGHCPSYRGRTGSWFFDRSQKTLNDKKQWFGGCGMTVICVSDWLNRTVGQSILKDKPRRMIYNWVDTEAFRPVDGGGLRGRLNLRGKFVILGVASQWGKNKGLGDFERLSAMIESDMAIVLVGRRPKKADWNSNIIFTGPVVGAETLSQYYSMAGVFFNPSTEETFGLVTAEALACGTPVIVYNTTACPELVGECCGMVASPGNLGKIMKYIRYIKKESKSAFSMACRQFACRNFSKTAQLQLYCELYDEIYAKGKEARK